jgi:hypothetical protein
MRAMKNHRLPHSLLLIAALAVALPSVGAAPKKKASTKAKAAAVQKAPEPPAPLTEGQLTEAGHVFTGHADCEFKQSVDVQPVAGQPGHFDLAFGKQHFHMIPEETTTGAVRLHDPRADVVWVQIPAKSMLLDQRAGHRLVDACQHAEQKGNVEAIAQAQLAASAAERAASAATDASRAASAAEAASAAARAASAAVSASALPQPPLGIAPAASAPVPAR